MSNDSTRIAEETLEKYREFVNPSQANLLKFSGFAAPEKDASGCYIRDMDGNEYLDCVGGYGAFSLGHLHPKVVQAVKDQLGKEALKSHYFMSTELADLCELLAQVTPGDLQYSFICNSGTEAVEGALKAARIHTGRTGFVGATNGFHGKTFGSLSVSGREIYKEAFHPLLPGARHVPFGDVQSMESTVDESVAAVILEAVQGEAGVILPPDGYLEEVRRICDKRGALLILDEVRTGFGRTGAMFASEHYGVVPDIVTMAKALGGGVMPIGAFSAKPAIWSSMFERNPYLHSTTFGGNPLACAASIAAIQTTIEEGLVARSAELGDALLTGLKEIGDQYPDIVKEVRGKGLLAGIEFLVDDFASLVIAACGRQKLLVAYSLNNPNVIRIEPPFIITEEELKRAISIIGECIAEVQRICQGLM